MDKPTWLVAYLMESGNPDKPTFWGVYTGSAQDTREYVDSLLGAQGVRQIYRCQVRWHDANTQTT
jgi:hypothetical protein